jgi:hypothetical protein
MKPRDIFGLVLRLVGLIFLYHGLNSVPLAISAVWPRFPHMVWPNVFPAILTVGWPLLVSYWLIRGASPLMRWAYPVENSPESYVRQ